MFINFGVLKALTASEKLTLDSYNQIQSIISTYITKATKLDKYGMSDKATPIFGYGNKLIYLVALLTIVRQRILKDYNNCNLQTFSYYSQTYQLDCIRKTFSCLPIPFDVTGLYTIFGLNNHFGFDGIGYMSIQNDLTPVCNNSLIFQVGKP